jgi:hypothetical protein
MNVVYRLWKRRSLWSAQKPERLSSFAVTGVSVSSLRSKIEGQVEMIALGVAGEPDEPEQTDWGDNGHRTLSPSRDSFTCKARQVQPLSLSYMKWFV